MDTTMNFTRPQEKEFKLTLPAHSWQQLSEHSIEVAGGSIDTLMQDIVEHYLESLNQQPILSRKDLAAVAIALIGGSVKDAISEPKEAVQAFLNGIAPFPPSLKLDIALIMVAQLKATATLEVVVDHD